MTHTVWRLFLIGWMTCCIGGCLSAGRPNDIRPGSVEIQSLDGAIQRSHEAGFADLEHRVPMLPNTAFRIASLTKQFTAVAVLRLVEDGKLTLDDVLAQRLPDYPPAWRSISIRQLLSHTSGLTGDLTPLASHMRDDLSPTQIIDLYAPLPLDAAPGAHWSYSNLNYWILGQVIESVSGGPYSAYVDQYVLAPAGLIATRIGDWAPIIPNRARGYQILKNGEVQNAAYFSSAIGYSAGGYLSTPEDMARWYGALSRGDIISVKLITEALTEMKLSNGAGSGYGLGWYVSNINGLVVAHQGGSTFGFRAYVYWAPSINMFAGVFMNTEGEEPKARAHALFESGVAPKTKR